jgi:peptidoglycan/LPS O-acetylase OafA/YrhL
MSRNIPIDRLRGASILAVMLMHASDCFPNFLIPETWRNVLLRNGYYGVATFFAISGFLITGKLIDSMARFTISDLRNFYVSRIARIFPCFALAVVVLAAASAWGPDFFQVRSPSTVWSAAFDALTFRANVNIAYHHRPTGGPWDTLWSLSIEEVFYLVFPLLILALRNRRMIMLVLIAVAISGVLYRASVAKSDGLNTLYQYPSAVDLIAIGCVARIVRPEHLGSKAAAFLTTVGLMVLAIDYFTISVPQNLIFGPTVAAISASAVLIASKFLTNRARRSGWLSFLGRHSYELYLFHRVILFLSLAALGPLFSLLLPWVVPYVLVCSLLAWALAKYFSDPANQWIRTHLQFESDRLASIHRPAGGRIQ